MTVSLSSLKVVGDFDASAYTRGAAQKTEADKRMIESDKAAAAAQREVALALVAAGAQLGQYADALTDHDRAMRQAISGNDDMGRSLLVTGVQTASLANHLKTAAVAAYALSPAFRGLVNPAIAASVRAIGPAAASAAGAALSAMGPLLATVGRLTLVTGLAVEGFRAMSAITELGAQKMQEFGETAAKAAAAGVTTDFFQRQAAGAKDFGIEANLATDALKKFNDATREQLGGSAFTQRLNELTKAGNFEGNPGVAALQQATDTQSRYRAVVDLITVAADQGQRLAALDLASKFLPPELLERLRSSGSTLKDLQTTADAIKPADIVGPDEIGYALELKRRLDDANDVIANKFKPIQKDLAMLGLNYQESWVNITEIMAGAVTKGTDLYNALKGIPGLFADAGNASLWSKLTAYSERLGLNSDPKSLGLTLPTEPGFNFDAARAELGARLRDPDATRQAMLQATAVQSAVRGDTSINPTTAKETNEVNDAVDRAINTLRRHTEQQAADTAAMGLGVGALARFRAEAAETSAIQANDGKITADQAAQFEALKTKAEAAAIALEKARVANSISFGRATSLLSPDDVQIAQQLKGLYPDVATALSSVEAAGMRTNQALSGLSSSLSGTLTSGLTDIVDGTKSVKAGFADMTKIIIRSVEEMVIKMMIVAPLMRSLQGLMSGGLTGGGSALSGLGNAAGSAASVLGSLIPSAKGNVFYGGNVIPFASGGIVSRPTYFPMAGGRTGLAGEAGHEAIIPLRRGSDGKLGVAASGGGSGGSITNVNIIGAPSQPSVSSQPNADGGQDITVTFRKMMEDVGANSIANGAMGRAMEAKYGVKRATA